MKNEAKIIIIISLLVLIIILSGIYEVIHFNIAHKTFENYF
jgi:hypothetical protein